MWEQQPQILLTYPQAILVFVLMVLATLLARVGLVRSTLALKAVYAAASKQEPLQHVNEQG